MSKLFSAKKHGLTIYGNDSRELLFVWYDVREYGFHFHVNMEPSDLKKRTTAELRFDVA